MQHRGSETAQIIPFAYQRLPSTKQSSWNLSNIIIFQTIYPLEQKRDGRQQADRLHRKAEIIPLRCQKGPSLNSHLGILHTSSSKPCPLEQKLDERCKAKYILNGSNSSFPISKKGHALVIHLKILQTTYFVIIYSLQCSRLSEIVAIPGHTHLFFAEAHLIN